MSLHSDADSFVSRVGATLHVDTVLGRLAISICTPHIIRVHLQSSSQPTEPSYVAPRAWPDSAFDVRMGEPIVVTTGPVQVHVYTDPARLAFADESGTVLLRQPLTGAMNVERMSVASTEIEAAENSHYVKSSRVAASFEWLGEQHFYGLGEGDKQFDRLGSSRQLWNSHIVRGPGSDIGIPLLLSHKGYGLFFDNTSDARLVVGRTDAENRIVFDAEDGPLDWYYLSGGSAGPRGVLAQVATLLGRATLPPRWALGFLQSTRHFEDTAELVQLPRTLRDKQFPCDALIFLSTYSDYMGCNRGVGHLEFPPRLWPQPAEIIAGMHEQHFHVVTHEYPVLHEDSPLFAEAAREGYLLAEGYRRVIPSSHPSDNHQEGQRYIDFSNPVVREWWWRQHRPLVDAGVDGWWLDGGEGPPASATLHEGDGIALHNMYDRLRFTAFAEGEAGDNPQRRVFLLCRSGAAGMQRDGATCWSGDVNNTFATLEAQVPLGLNTGLSGVPFWGTDIGGFFHPIPETGELFARWFQFGAFCPIFRAHGWVWREHVPWAYGPQVEEICRRYTQLRYRLFPYTYTLAWQARALGLPLMRPLVLNYPDDPRVWELGSEYLWGDDLLVAPVTREGATQWPVYLPAGGWYDFWSQERYDGPCGVTVPAPLDRLPLFARAGAIIPLGPLMQYHDEHVLDQITLLVYPEGSSHFTLYEDDGSTNAYLHGHHAQTTFTCIASGEGIILRIGEPAGDSSVVPLGRIYTWQVVCGRPRRVTLAGGGDVPERGSGSIDGPAWWYDSDQFTFIQLPARAEAIIEL